MNHTGSYRRRIAGPQFLLVALISLLMAASAAPARAALFSRGTVNAQNGFPGWYQDNNGVALALCTDPNDANCLADPVIPGNSFSQQIGFGAEVFYWLTTGNIQVPAGGVLATGGDADIVMAMEGTFLTGAPEAGQQQTFTRMRIRVDVAAPGTYTIMHPYGQTVFSVPQERIDATGGIRAISEADIGQNGLTLVSSDVPLGDTGCVAAPCDFDLALPGSAGPFLKWDPAVAPAAPAGYLGNPNIGHVITGGVNNLYRVTGPPNAFGAGVSFIETGSFLVSGKVANIMPAAGDYFWTWYDSQYMRNWVLMANPSSATQNLGFNLMMAGVPRNLPDNGLGSGNVAPGDILSAIFPNQIGGPVKVTSRSGGRAIVSQRTLLGDSFDEVPGTEFERLSDHFFWTWYDMLSPGYTNWILISNPDPVDTIFYRIKVAGVVKDFGPLAGGASVTPTFPGVMGGPVEVEAWTDDVGGLVAAKVMASQRVLSHNGAAFNEEPGIPASELSNRYVWTWYDMQEPNASNWILIANPPAATAPIYYDISIGGVPVSNGGPVAPGGIDTPAFPGQIGGPLEVRTFTDPQNPATTPANSIVSQRVTWGPSFEETPGRPVATLDSSNHWTWYDMQSPNVTNWILIANPVDAAGPIYYRVKIGGFTVDTGGPITPGGNVTPTFPGRMDGPVEVITYAGALNGPPADAIASQRVLWNGYFNEVMGTVLLPPI